MIDEKQIRSMREFFQTQHSLEECVAFYQQNFGPLLTTAEDLLPIAKAARRWVRAPAGREASEAEAELVEALQALS